MPVEASLAVAATPARDRVFVVLTRAEAEGLTAIRLTPDHDAALRALAKIQTALEGLTPAPRAIPVKPICPFCFEPGHHTSAAACRRALDLAVGGPS